MRRRTAATFLLLAVLFVLTACGQADGGGSALTETSGNAAPAQGADDSNNSMLWEIPDEYRVGDIPADFEVELLNGEMITLSDLKGKVVLLNFWDLSCKLCLLEMPAFDMLLDKYGDDLVILAINSGDRKEKIEKYMSENSHSFKVGVDRARVIQFPGDAIPYSLVIDRQGTIQSVHTGGTGEADQDFIRYDSEIEKLLGQ
ncbi:TlpA family protein disulfide reductase [Christensenella intestinihominis]|uniref:TlpA family protein disulfide reductase n=1 Tax=Christensenella intestinihominis TaxID=1851429 RepID=UPI0009F206E2|nr:TlpA disulfide reductase family protein [Christensenella intestinihominis]